MTNSKRTPSGAALSDTIFDLLQLNSRILTAGDRLVAGLGLTSARWQVLGTMIAAQRPQPVAWIARDMGANRQNVQRIVNDLARDGLVEFQPNPHHRRAQLVVLTDKGMTAYDDAMQLQTPWVNDLAEGLQPEDIEVTRKVITALRLKLEDGGAADA
ncbi:MarR family transcriptional regulator [Mesobaculum littorinae]|uniref:MarR family transcriptional regulator n=1 Tax=Mesobaculum littorinae TaxID=2486419 RepID=A0A438AEG2_9RHOB|nr:MarR family transcriptional regulator [Mesobaculum littorinae]